VRTPGTGEPKKIKSRSRFYRGRIAKMSAHGFKKMQNSSLAALFNPSDVEGQEGDENPNLMAKAIGSSPYGGII
jgi:hypothetical protein